MPSYTPPAGSIHTDKRGNKYFIGRKQTGMRQGQALYSTTRTKISSGDTSKRIKNNEKQIADLQSQLKKQKAAPAAKPQPKPKGDQQIDPVKDSPEISAARKVVNDFQAGMKDNKSPWAQAQADAADSATFGNFNPGGKTSSDQPQKDPQEFADKYKLNLIQSGATKKASEPGDTPMTGKQILAQDKQQGWS